ncbi:CHAT domain-containing protein [Chitinophaga horti]|uniref:CHAT domain-containing protein n=1 Tax=Chitinophaga horti TaxID=2920382 RepID=A0ABY6IXE8_9BACT|nr:CHAT domain-containing protein [Chitinophaga horti]UYQ91876.1 CHAT domain-containing protein [Chitinophaga horti]
MTWLCCVYANALFAQDTSVLRKLQQADNLEEWLYARMDYAAEDPAHRLTFLMATQSAAWRFPRNNHERLAWLDLHTYQGYYQLYTGHIIPSIQAYEAAYRYYYDDPVPDTDVLEFVLMPLGNNYTRLGDYERAQFIHDKSLRIARERNDARAIAGACSNLAVAAQMLEQFDEAKRYAWSGLQSAPPGSSIAGLLHATLADVYHETKQQDSARYHVKKAISILSNARKEENTHYWLSSASQVAGNVAATDQRPQEALRAYRQALYVLDAGRKRERARLLVKAGNIYLQMKQPAVAVRQFEQALGLMLPGYKNSQLPDSSSLYGEFMLIDALEGKARALVEQGDKQQALQYLLLTFAVERKLRREFFSRSTRMLHQQQSRILAETAMELAYDLYNSTGNNQYAHTLLDISEMSKSQTLMEELWTNLQYSRLQSSDSLLARQRRLMQAMAYYEREAALAGQAAKSEAKEVAYELSLLQEKLKVKYPMLYQRSRQDVFSQLPEGTAVKSFFAGERYIFIIDLDRKGIHRVQRLDSGAVIQRQVKDFVSTYFRNGPQAMINVPSDYYQAAWRLYQQLWQRPVTGKRCLVVPDGWLGYLPFDALVTDSIYSPNIARWPYLLHHAPIGLAYSLETWLQQQQQPAPQQANLTGFFIAQGTAGRPPIPAVQKEYEAVSAAVGGQFFREKEASLANLRKAFASAAVLHLGTHAALQGKQDLPLLELADGQFFLFELYGLQFHPRLVVLSACRTGDGMLAEGEGIISLAREFAASGAGGIVAGLWNVHDAAAAGITGTFYRHLQHAESPLAALHDAKKDWLRSAHDNQLLKLPYYWASLTYAGHHHPVAIIVAKNNSKWMYWLEALLLSLLAGGLTWWYVFYRQRYADN